MLPNQFEDIGPDDILRLVENRVSERKVLEYKEALNIGPDNERAEFLADVSSFANASGGDLIFGISDERDEDDRPTGIPKAIVPLQLTNAASECARIEQIIQSGLEPRVPVVQVKAIDIAEQGPVIVVRVGKSWIAPHMVSFKNRSRFYSRNGIGKIQLDVQQIGAAFALQRGLGERLRAWKTERVAKALSGDGPIPLSGSRLLLHFVSASALTSDEEALPRIFDNRTWGSANSLMTSVPQFSRYNADGFLLFFSDTGQSDRQTYLQLFRDGRLEYGDSYLFNSKFQDQIPSALFEEAIEKTFGNAMLLLSLLKVSEPVFVSLTLLGMRNRRMALPGNAAYPPFSNIRAVFDRDVIVCPDVRVENLAEGSPYPTTLLPVLNFIWQAAGLKQSPYIKVDGAWLPGR